MDGYPEILKAYLAERGPTSDLAEAVATGRPYLLNGHAHVFSEDLAPWLSQWERSHRRRSANLEMWAEFQSRTAKEIDRFLLGIGSKQVPLLPVGGAHSSIRQAWRLE